MAKNVTLEELYHAIEALKAKMPNGELLKIREDVDGLQEHYKSIKQDLSDIKVKLLNPEDGVVVKNNQTRDRLTSLEQDVTNIYDTVNDMDDDVKDLKSFKKVVSGALYVVYATTVGLIINAIKNLF